MRYNEYEVQHTNKYQQHTNFHPDQLNTFGHNIKLQMLLLFRNPVTLNPGQGQLDYYQSEEFNNIYQFINLWMHANIKGFWCSQ